MKDFPAVIFLCLLLFTPEKSKAAALQALRIWGLDLVPSLFPYMVLCQTLTHSLLRQKNQNTLFPFVLGLLGGSPSASAVLSLIAQNKTLNRQRLLLLAAMAGTISPMFFLSLTSSWFNSFRFAISLLFTQYAAALLTGMLFYHFASDQQHPTENTRPVSASENNLDPLSSSIHAILSVGGYIVLFSTAAAYIPAGLSSVAHGLPQALHALLEVSGGLHALSNTVMNDIALETLVSGLCGFGGLSILNQNHLFLCKAGLRKSDLLALSICRAVFSILIYQLLRFIL